MYQSKTYNNFTTVYSSALAKLECNWAKENLSSDVLLKDLGCQRVLGAKGGVLRAHPIMNYLGNFWISDFY